MTEEATQETSANESAETSEAAATQDTVGAGNDDPKTSAESEPKTDDKPAESYDWRKEIAGDDEKAYKKLERFSDLKAYNKSYDEATKRISEGFKAPELPKDATEEQIKEYREKIGVPESAEGYKMPEGFELSDEEKPLYDGFLSIANEYNLSQADWEKVAPAYRDFEKAIQEQQEASVKETVRANEQALKEAWGSDYQANLNINENFLVKHGGDELKSALFNGFDANGAPLMNSPVVASFLNQTARMSGFSDGMTYDSESDAQNVSDSISEIMAKRTGENRESYYKNTKQVEKDDAKLAELYEIRERFKNS